MCGIIGFKSKKFLDMKEVQGFLLQSKIRGQHATGIAWVEDKKLKSYAIRLCAEGVLDLRRAKE